MNNYKLTSFRIDGQYNYVPKKMHPALRSRIRGYGYEVLMKNEISDTAQNRELYYQFIAQEVIKDGKIPHFSKTACNEIIKIARKFSGKKKKLTLKFRELGGLIRAAGDLAKEDGSKFVTVKHVRSASLISKTLVYSINI